MRNSASCGETVSKGGSGLKDMDAHCAIGRKSQHCRFGSNRLLRRR
jgi:hypothetical protein